MDSDFLRHWKYFDAVVVCAAIVANCYILLALLLCHIKLTGYRRFLLSITAGDLYTCFVSILALVYQYYYAGIDQARDNDVVDSDHYLLTEAAKCNANLLRSLKLAGFYVHLLNLCGLSFDHVLGIVYPMKYGQLWDMRLLRCLVPLIWVLSFTLAFFDLPIGIIRFYTNHGSVNYTSTQHNGIAGATETSSDEEDLNYLRKLLAASYADEPTEPVIFTTAITHARYVDAKGSLNHMLQRLASNNENEHEEIGGVCTLFQSTKMLFEFSVIALAIICFIFIVACYIVIFRKVHNRMVSSAGNHSRKLITATFIFLGTFVICWGPFLIYEFMTYADYEASKHLRRNESETYQAYSRLIFIGTLLNSVLMFYPLIDPLVYATKIPAINRTVLAHFAACVPCFEPAINNHLRAFRQDSIAHLSASRQSSVNNIPFRGSTRRLKSATSSETKQETNSFLKVTLSN